MEVEILLIGNEGFRISSPSAAVCIDSFYGRFPGAGAGASIDGADLTQVDLILVTHAHWDHFDAGRVADAAARSGASVVGPASVIDRLRGKVAADALVELEPLQARRTETAASRKATLGETVVTAFRTFHSPDHNSYLVEMPGCRFFHDGDNEDTRRIAAGALGKLDALFIAPWQGSDWVTFIEALAPRRWFMMHLSDKELDLHEAGVFLPDLCDHVPQRLVTLRPGQSFVLE